MDVLLILENIALAFTALLANKMRSILTMLGIIIGIGSVIAIVTVGNSLSASITSSMEGMGANNITVGLQQKETEEEITESGMTFRGPDRRRNPTEDDYFTIEMIEELKAAYPDDIRDVAIEMNLGNGTVDRGRNYANVNVNGVNRGSLDNSSLEILAGSSLSDKALDGGKGVAVVSNYFVNNLFGGDMQEALGKEVEVVIGTEFYTYVVVGVYEFEQTSFSSSSVTDTVTTMYVPLKNVQKRTHVVDKCQQFTIVSNTGVDPDTFMPEVERFFDKYYHSNDYFEVSAFSLASMVSTLTDMMDKVSLAISVIAGISLLVGGIGVMNIMMVSISERTREIGTRKALGATNGSIRLQFIVEAMVLCLVGGVFGIALGIGGGAIGANVLGYEARASVNSILISLLFSLVIGVFFGFYPANKAAKMNPIDALRYE